MAELATPQKAPLSLLHGEGQPEALHPGLTGDYWRDVGSVFRGYGKALVNTALSPYHLGKAFLRDPRGFVAGLPGNIVGGIRGTVQGIFQLDNPELFGESFGSVLISAATPQIAAAGVTGVRVARNALPKVGRLADECSDFPLVGAASSSFAPPNLVYSAHYLKRSANGRDKFHNYPMTFDGHIVREGTRIVVSDSFHLYVLHLYVLRGVVNGRTGVFEIGLEPFKSGRNARVTHRFFKPDMR